MISLEVMFFLALAHFIYESILAPSWRLSLRFRLFALRDELRALKADCHVFLDDEHYDYLQDSTNTMIAMLHRYDVAAIAAAELRYHKDPLFRRRIDIRATVLDDGDIPQAQSIRRRSVELIARAVAVNSGMLCAPLIFRPPTGGLVEEMKHAAMRYAVVIEAAGANFSAYVPDLPGCIATGSTPAEAEAAIREAIRFHLDGLREDGLPIPSPSSRVEYVEVAA